MAGRKMKSAQQVRDLIQNSDDDEENSFVESPPKRKRNKLQLTREKEETATARKRRKPSDVSSSSKNGVGKAVEPRIDEKDENHDGDCEPVDDPEYSEAPTTVPGGSKGRRHQRSPMFTGEGAQSGTETDESEDLNLTANVRKSLKFDELLDEAGPSQTVGSNAYVDVEMEDLEEDEPSTLEKTDQEIDVEPPESAPKNDALYMVPSEVKRIMATVEDNWENEKAYLMETYAKKFPEWHLALRLKLNILVYGVGSKKDLLEKFRTTELVKEPTLVMDGFSPNHDLKSNISDFCQIITAEKPPKQEDELLEILSAHIAKNYEHFNMVIHSIDGPRYRNSASQKLLVKLAQIPNVHIIASMDHPNLPLLWNPDDLAALRWVYFHMSTMETYSEYPLPELTIKGEKGQSMKLASLKQVFAGLTKNAKQIFEEIAKYQIKEEDDMPTGPNTETGIPYGELYKVCRVEFLVNSDVALRKQLVEYFDHDLLKSHRAANGQEYLTIPIDKTSLKSFLEKPDD